MQLRPDQQKTVDHLAPILMQTGSTLDASDCGAGKTYVAAGLCRQLGLSAFVVAPKATLPEWRRVLKSAGVDIEECLSWEKARRIKSLEHKKGRVFLFDECHKAKNRKTANAKFMLKAAATGRIHMMSATAIMDPIDMGALGPVLGLFQPRQYWNWCLKNGCEEGHFGGLVFTGGVFELDVIHNQIFPSKGVRVRKEDIPDFPDCDVQVMELDLGKDVAKAYRAMAKEAGVRVDELFGDSEEADNPLTRNLKTRQAVELAKAPALIELVQEYRDAGASPVLFLNFRETIETVAAKFPGCAVIMGGNDNTAEMEKFQSGSTHICIVSIGAGGTGINLHDVQGVGPRVGLLCPTDDPRAAEQAEGRLRRAGSKSKAALYKVFAAGTVEEVMAERERSKREKIATINNGLMSEEKITENTAAENTVTLAPTKRRRSEFRASFAENLEKSPCATTADFESTPFTESGNRVHKCVETNELSHAENEEEVKLAQICINYAKKFKGEALKEYAVQIHDNSRGLADLFVREGTHGDLLDWKTGQRKQTPAESNFQQQLYVLALLKEFEKLKTIAVHLVYPRLGVVSHHVYSRDDMPRLQKRLDDMVSSVREARATGELTPSEACKNCGKRGSCPALASKVTAIAARYDGALEVPEAATHPSKVTDPKVMAHLMRVKKIMVEWCKSVDHHAKKMALEENIVPEGYEVRHRTGRREIKDAAAAYSSVMDVLDAEDFLRACSVSAAKLETEYAAKANRGSKAQAKRDLNERLADLGILNTADDIPYLSLIKE